MAAATGAGREDVQCRFTEVDAKNMVEATLRGVFNMGNAHVDNIGKVNAAFNDFLLLLIKNKDNKELLFSAGCQYVLKGMTPLFFYQRTKRSPGVPGDEKVTCQSIFRNIAVGRIHFKVLQKLGLAEKYSLSQSHLEEYRPSLYSLENAVKLWIEHPHLRSLIPNAHFEDIEFAKNIISSNKTLFKEVCRIHSSNLLFLFTCYSKMIECHPDVDLQKIDPFDNLTLLTLMESFYNVREIFLSDDAVQQNRLLKMQEDLTLPITLDTYVEMYVLHHLHQGVNVPFFEKLKELKKSQRRVYYTEKDLFKYLDLLTNLAGSKMLKEVCIRFPCS